jgi:hypothetical protein
VIVPESEDEKDPKKTHTVLSKGCKVVGSGYSRLSGDAARATDRGEELGNLSQVGRVCQEYDMDRRIDRVTWDNRGNRDRYSIRWMDWVTRDSRGNRDGGSGQQADWVTWVSQGNRDSNPKSGNSTRVDQVGNTEQKTGCSSRVVNTKSWAAENSANMESQVAENSGKMES